MLRVNQLAGFGMRRSGGIGGNDANAILLCHFDGADEATTTTDSSAAARTLTAQGAAKLDDAQLKFGTASTYLDGSAASWRVNESIIFGTQNFTIDVWIRPSSIGGTRAIFGNRVAGGVNSRGSFGFSSGELVFDTENGAGTGPGGATISVDTWQHVALEQFDGTQYAYLDGVIQSSTAFSHNLSDGSDWYIGRDGTRDAWARFVGWMDELRVSDLARYGGSNFTPPAGPYS